MSQENVELAKRLHSMVLAGDIEPRVNGRRCPRIGRNRR
jgi:hypothetical protein